MDYVLDKHLSYLTTLENKQKIDQFIEKVDIIYLLIDLDVFSYTQAPGVSSLAVVEQPVEHIFLSKKVRLVDIAKCNPLYDIQNYTARLAA